MFVGRRGWISKDKQREQICPSFAFLFYLGPQPRDWIKPTLIGEDDLLTQSTISNVDLFQKHSKAQTLSDTPRDSQTHLEIMSYQLSRHPLAQSS